MTKTLNNFIRGVGSVVEIAPHRENRGVTTGRFFHARRDKESIEKDWRRVWQDIKGAASKECQANAKTNK